MLCFVMNEWKREDEDTMSVVDDGSLMNSEQAIAYLLSNPSS